MNRAKVPPDVPSTNVIHLEMRGGRAIEQKRRLSTMAGFTRRAPRRRMVRIDFEIEADVFDAAAKVRAHVPRRRLDAATPHLPDPEHAITSAVDDGEITGLVSPLYVRQPVHHSHDAPDTPL
jgi:hypothetical protein